MKTGNSKLIAPACSHSGKVPLLVTAYGLLYHHGAKAPCGISSLRALIPLWRLHLHHMSTYQRPLFLIPSHQALGFKHWSLGEHKHSDYNTHSSTYIQFSSVQSLSCVRLFATPWITARQASLSITNSWSSLRLTSIESVMPSSHLIHLIPSSPASSPLQHQSLFQWVNPSLEVAKVLEFQL